MHVEIHIKPILSTSLCTIYPYVQYSHPFHRVRATASNPTPSTTSPCPSPHPSLQSSLQWITDLVVNMEVVNMEAPGGRLTDLRLTDLEATAWLCWPDAHKKRRAAMLTDSLTNSLTNPLTDLMTDQSNMMSASHEAVLRIKGGVLKRGGEVSDVLRFVLALLRETLHLQTVWG